MITDLRVEFTPELESDIASGKFFKTVAVLIVVLMLGALAAYFYFGSGMSIAPATRIALVSPPAVPLKPVIAPRMVAPTPQASLHPRRHPVQQSADLQPATNASGTSATADPPDSPPVTSSPVTMSAPPVAEPAAPAQLADPAQPAPHR